MFTMCTYSVVILALNSRKSGQIANKGFMIYYGRHMAQLALLKSLKQNPVQFRDIDKNDFHYPDRLR